MKKNNTRSKKNQPFHFSPQTHALASLAARQDLDLPPPINKMGVTDSTEQPCSVSSTFQAVEFYQDLNVDADALLFPDFEEVQEEQFEKRVLSQRGNRVDVIKVPLPMSGVSVRSAFVDQVSFTVKVADVLKRQLVYPYRYEKNHWNHAPDSVYRLSSIMLNIFGFGITQKRQAGGVNFYEQTWQLGEHFGLLSYGGQRDTINVQIFGMGCMSAKKDWAIHLARYLKKVKGHLTRIDLAADLFDGQYTPMQAEADYKCGLMSTTNAKQTASRAGDWYNVGGGRTFYVGSRQSGKMMRVYEKGVQVLGKLATKKLSVQDAHILDKYKDWVRVEVEWHNKARILPIDMLIDCGAYFAGAYPVLHKYCERQCTVKTFKKIIQATVERAFQTLSQQYGSWIWAMIQLRGVEVVKELTLGREKLPRWASALIGAPYVDDEQWLSFESLLSVIPF